MRELEQPKVPPRGFFDSHSEMFSSYLAAAAHQDRIHSWPKWQQWAHWLLVSWRCPACKLWKGK